MACVYAACIVQWRVFMPMACFCAACIVQVTVAAGVPRDAKPIVSGDFLSRLVEFPRFLSLLVVIVFFLFVTLLHVSEYENAFPGLRLVKTALYDTMLLSFRLPALVLMHYSQIDILNFFFILSLSTCVALNSFCPYSLPSRPGTRTKAQALSRRPSLSMQTCTSG